MAGASGGPWDPGLTTDEESVASPASSTTSTDSNPEGVPDWCKPIHKLQFGAQPEKVPEAEWQCSLKCKENGKLFTCSDSAFVEVHIKVAHPGAGKPVSMTKWRCSLNCKKTGLEEVLMFQDSQAAEKHILREHPDPIYSEFVCTKCPEKERRKKVSPQQILDHQSHTIQKGGHYVKNTVDRRRSGMKSKTIEDNCVRALHKDTRKEYMVFREKARHRFLWYICVSLRLTSYDISSVGLGVQKKQIYNIPNGLEVIVLVEKKSKNTLNWCSAKNHDLSDANADLYTDLADLEAEENQLDALINNAEMQLKLLTEDKRYAYVKYQDLMDIPTFRKATCITLKAPAGANLMVPDYGSDWLADDGFLIHVSSKSGAIEAKLISEPTSHEDKPGDLYHLISEYLNI